jgi:hypothetical protein
VLGASNGQMSGMGCWEFVIPLSMEQIQRDELWPESRLHSQFGLILCSRELF